MVRGVHTLSVHGRRQLMHLIRYRHRPCLQHLIIQLLLLHLSQLVIQLRLIDRVAEHRTRNGSGNLLAQGVLFPKVLPAIR